jgi:hypothetical protein
VGEHGLSPCSRWVAVQLHPAEKGGGRTLALLGGSRLAGTGLLA